MECIIPRVSELRQLKENTLYLQKSTVLVENLPPDFSMESIQEKFGTVGKYVFCTFVVVCASLNVIDSFYNIF